MQNKRSYNTSVKPYKNIKKIHLYSNSAHPHTFDIIIPQHCPNHSTLLFQILSSLNSSKSSHQQSPSMMHKSFSITLTSNMIYSQDVSPNQLMQKQYHKISQIVSYSDLNTYQLSSEKRIKQRCIGQVIQNLRLWKNIWQYGRNGKKYSLIKAAEVVGISKKTLQDYKKQVEIGQSLGFDFNLNWKNKMGVLRKFVKQNYNKAIYKPSNCSIISQKIECKDHEQMLMNKKEDSFQKQMQNI